MEPSIATFVKYSNCCEFEVRASRREGWLTCRDWRESELVLQYRMMLLAMLKLSRTPRW